MLASDEGRSTRPFVHEPEGYAVLAATLGVTAEDLEAELERRAAFLEDLADRGVCDAPAVAAALSAYPG